VYPSTIAIAAAGEVSAVQLTITGISHEFPADIDVLLVSPDGRALIVLADAGGSNPVTGVTLTLVDSAPTTVPSPMVSGTFRPTTPGLASSFPPPAPPGAHPAASAGTTLNGFFQGAQAVGSWSLFVIDDASQDVGSISGGWSLTITARLCREVPAQVNVGGAVGAIAAVAAQQARENRERAAAAAVPAQPTVAVSAPRTGTGVVSVTPPNTGDGGLIEASRPGELVIVPALLAGVALFIARHRVRAR
jgi:subtilisin-like proprotein convertase family protein